MDYTKAEHFLHKMLSIPTVNGTGEEGRLARWIADELRSHGIDVWIQELPDGLANVIARIDGEDPSHTLVLNGHLDTVPYGDESHWHSNPAVPVERDGRIYARGTSDMKSGLAAMLFAICDLADQRVPPRRSLLFLGTADEESGGKGAMAVKAAGLLDHPDALLIAEPTGGAMGLAQKGCLWLRLETAGVTSHGAYPWKGVNAVELGFELCRQLHHYVMRYHHPLLGAATSGIAQVGGGVASNMVPDSCVFQLDIRTVPPLGIEQLLTRARELGERLAAEHPGFSVRLEAVNCRRAVATAGDHPEVKLVRESIREVAGRLPEEVGVNFFTDASILADEQPELPVILYGPGRQELAHQPDEWVALDAYKEAAAVYRKIISQ